MVVARLMASRPLVRQVRHVARAENLRHGGIIGLDGRYQGFHSHGLGHGAYRQRNIGANRLIDVDDDAGLGHLLKTALLHRDAVNADADKFEGVIALSVGGGGMSIERASLRSSDLGIRE